MYSGEAAGTALDLSVLGKQATFGMSAARANSAGAAKARGISHASSTVEKIDEVLGDNSSDVVADVKAGDPAVSNNRTCQSPTLPSTISDVLTIGIACADADANSLPSPSATAEGSVAELDLHVDSVIETLETKANVPIGNTLAGVLDQVCTKVNQTCPATTTVRDLVQSVLKTQTLDVELGKSTSSVTVNNGSVTSNATAAGAVVKILPLPQVNGLPSTEPVVTITIGDAKATASYDRRAGSATSSVDPALVRIEFNDTVAGIVGRDEIVITPQDILGLGLNELLADLPAPSEKVVDVCDEGRAICILQGTDLESRIYLATGSAKADGGTASAVADAVRLDLLMGLTEELSKSPAAAVVGDPTLPGLRLALAHAEATVGGRVGSSSTPTTVPGRNGGEPPLELPRGDFPTKLATTGGLPVVPLLGMALLGLAVAFRRATAKATR